MACPSSEVLNWQWTPQMVSPLRGHGSPHRGAADRWWRPGEEGPHKTRAHGTEEQGQIGAHHGSWRQVVLEALTFIRLLAKAKARHEPNLMRERVEQAWRMRWCSLLECAAARSPHRSWN